jgi:hypothetical protein
MSTDQQQWLTLVEDASANVKAARLLDADWPAGTLETADEALDAALGAEPPPPPPAPVVGLAGSYAGHDPAIDAYLGGPWGPHHGIALQAPAPGRVELYQFGTPLPVLPADPVYARNHADLFRGWVCIASPPYQTGVGAGQQQMAVFVWWPDTPYVVAGVPLLWIGGAHVDPTSVRQGHVNTGDTMALTSNSGINFERAGYAEARAAHWHAICGRSRQLSPNGDVSGALAIQALGFPAPVLGPKPGPTQYEQRGADGKCLYCAGRLRSDFLAAGKPIPPMPQ